MEQGAPDTATRIQVLRRASATFLLLALISAGVMYLLFEVQASARTSATRDRQEELVAVGQQWIRDELASVTSDTRYLARLHTLRRWLDSGDPAARREMAEKYRVLAEVKARYERIRLIDVEGQEQVRVDWSPGSAAVVPESPLRGRWDRDDLDAVLGLEPGEVHVSRLDPGIPPGAPGSPGGPTIRFSAPVRDARGSGRGAVVLDYPGTRLLGGIEALAVGRLGQRWLLDEDGQWLPGPNAVGQRESAGTSPGGPSFADAYPEAWERIRGGAGSGQLLTDHGLFTYARITAATPPVSHPAGSVPQPVALAPTWILVAHVPAPVLARQVDEVARSFIIASVALGLLLAGVSLVIARHGARRRLDQARIREREARFSALLESAPDAVIITSTAGQIMLVNAQTEQLFGHPRDSLIGQSIEILVPEALRADHVRYRAEYAGRPSTRPMGVGLDLRALRADGTECPVEISLNPVQTDGEMLVVAEVRDVSAQRMAEQRIRELNARLAADNAELVELNKELEAFTYSVSHELRGPLWAIDQFCRALDEDCADGLGPAGLAHLARVREGTRRMSQVVEDLLSLAHITRADLSLEDVDLYALAHQVTDTLREEASARRVDLKIASGPSVRADPRLMRIVLENLLGNAWKFTAGRDEAHIEFGHCAIDHQLAFYVRDDGVGFDSAEGHQLFRVFQRLDYAREFPGSGIGLATVERIIHKHGGHIWATGQVERGATFYFTVG